MARVFETPTYTAQTAHAAVNMMDIADEYYGEGSADHRGRFKYSADLGNASDAFLFGFCNIQVPTLDDQLADTDIELIDSHMRYCFAEGIRTRDLTRYGKMAAYGSVLSKVLSKHSSQTIFTDFDATFELCRRYYSGEIKASATDKAITRWNFSHSVASNLFMAGCASCNLGRSPVERTLNGVKPYSGYTAELVASLHACEAWEKLRLSGSTREVADAHKEVEICRDDIEKFEVTGNYASRCLGFDRVYRVSVLTVLVSRDSLFILDHAHLDQVRAVLKTWYGMEHYAHYYRVADPLRNSRFLVSFRHCFSWFAKAMKTFTSRKDLAKWMKQCMSIMQNELHDHAEKLDLGMAKRRVGLEEDLDAICMHPEKWHDVISNSGCNRREGLNMAYMYHLLPCPDAPPLTAYRRFVAQIGNTNKGKPDVFKDFMNYVKASDLTKFLAKTHGRVEVISDPGYDWESRRWAQRCSSGDPQLPPEEEWGRAQVGPVIRAPVRIHTWYMTVGDVTRVCPDIGIYDSMLSKSNVNTFDCNELLYMLNNAPNIAPGYTPEKIVQLLKMGSTPWDKVADVAFKSENTKSSSKMRETLSADAITRELMSEYDQSLIQLAYMYPGVTSRKDECAVDSIFDRINAYTTGRGYCVIISNDASGWSPSAPRKLWSVHHDYNVGLTSIGSWLKLEKILDGLHVAIGRRGMLQHDPAEDGLFQGWTGTADSIFNVHISTYCVRRGKRLGYLPYETRADTAGLIDDAVQGIHFPAGMTKSQAQAAADMHFNTTVSVWSDVGAELNLTKTIYSTLKFIYLNRLYCQGSEVLVDMKTYSKIDRDYTKRLSSLMNQTDTIIGSSRASAARGSDPLLCYFYALHRCIDLAIQSNGTIMKLNAMQQICGFFAPRGLGGMGYPHIVAFLSKEKVDPISMFTGMIARMKNTTTSDSVKKQYDKYAMAFLSKELKKPSAMSVVSDPMSVRSVDSVSVEGNVYSTLRKKMKDKCKSVIIKEAFSLCDSDYASTVMDTFLKCVSIDAGLLAAFSETLPENCIQGLIDKAHKADLILALFPAQIRSKLISKIKGGNWKAVNLMCTTVINAGDPQESINAYNYLEIVVELRDKYFSSSGYRIVNSSYPDPGTVLSRQMVRTVYGIDVESQKPVSFCSDTNDMGQYRNWFDGSSPDKKRAAIKTQGYLGELPESARGLTPVQKCLMKLAQVAAHTTNIGDANLGSIIWRVGCMMWEAPADTPQKVPIVSIKPGVSWKRLLSGSRTHPIACLPNTHGCVKVAAGKLIDLCELKKNMTNVMSVITSAKIQYMLNQYSTAQPMGPLHYSLLPGSLSYIPICSMEVIDNANLALCMAQRPKDPRNSLTGAFIDSMVDYRDVALNEDDAGIVSLTFPPIGILARDGWATGTAEIVGQFYADNVLDTMDLWHGVEVGQRQVTGRHRGDYDETIVRHNTTSDTKFRRYSERHGPNVGLVRLYLETFQDNVPRDVPRSVYVTNPRELANVIPRLYPNWKISLENTIRTLHNVRGFPGIDGACFQNILGPLSPRHISILANKLLVLNPQYERSSVSLFATTLLCMLGNFRSREQYAANAAISPSMMERSWKFAAIAARYRADRDDSFYMSPALRLGVNTNRVVSSIYNNASRMPTGYATTEIISESLNNAFADAYLSGSLVAEDVNQSFIVNEIRRLTPGEVGTYDSRRTVIHEISRMIFSSGYTYDLSVVEEAIDNIISDCLVYSRFALGIQGQPEVEILVGEPIREMSALALTISDLFPSDIETTITVGQEDLAAVDIVNSARLVLAAEAVDRLDYERARSIMMGNEDFRLQSVDLSRYEHDEIEAFSSIVLDCISDLDAQEGAVAGRDD